MLRLNPAILIVVFFFATFLCVHHAQAQSISVYPNPVNATVNCGGKTSKTITVENYGTKELTYSASARLFAKTPLSQYQNFPVYSEGMVKVGNYVYVNNYEEGMVVKYDLTRQTFVSSFSVLSSLIGTKETSDLSKQSTNGKGNPRLSDGGKEFVSKLSLSAITYDGEYLWIAYNNGEVKAFTLNGESTDLSFTLPATSSPMLVFDGENFISANGWENNTNFYKVDYEGTVISTFTSSDTYLTAMTIAPDGNLWGLDYYDDFCVKQVSLTGNTAQTLNKIILSNTSDCKSIIHDGNDFYIAYYASTMLERYDDGLFNGVNWFSLKNNAGAVATGSSSDIVLNVDATQFSSGVYMGLITINSNDLLNSNTYVPFTINVNGEPAITLSANTLNFGSTYVGKPITSKFTVGNTSCGTAEINDVISTNAAFTVNQAQFVVGKNDLVDEVVTFNPNALGEYIDTLTLSYNGQDTMIILSATCITPPSMAVSVDSLIDAVECSGAANIPFTISNSGQSDLTYELTTYLDRPIDYDIAGKRLKSYSNFPEYTNGMVLIGQYIYGISTESPRSPGILFRYDTITQTIVILNEELEIPYGITYDGQQLWIGSMKAPLLFAYDLKGRPNGKILELMITSPELTFDGKNIIATSYRRKAFSIINPLNNHITTIESPPSYIRAITWSSANQAFWALDSHGWFSEIKFSGNIANVTDEFNVDLLNVGYGIIHDGNDILYCDMEGGLYRIDDGIDENIPNWISLSDISGTIVNNETKTINATFNGEGLKKGTYTGGILVSNNDPNQETDTVFCKLTVDGLAILSLSDHSLTLNNVIAGTTVTNTVTITNTGCDTLKISGTTNTSPYFNNMLTGRGILPGKSTNIQVSFSPSLPGSYIDTVVLSSNAGNDTLFVNASSVSAPILSVDTDTILVSVSTCNGTTSGVFEISNDEIVGTTPLEFNCHAVSEADLSRTGKLLNTIADGFTTDECGMVLVGDNMYIINYYDYSMTKFNIVTESVVDSYDIPFKPSGITYDGTYLWIGAYNNSFIAAFDLNGIDADLSINVPVQKPLLTFDGTYFIIAEHFANNPNIYRIDYEGNIIESYNSDIDGLFAFTWVPEHITNNLWVVDNLSTLKQINLSQGIAENVNIINTDYEISAIAHNGTNLFFGEEISGNIYVIDDGIDNQANWVTLSTSTGVINPLADASITVNFNAQGMAAGVHHANILVASNDPNNPADTIVCQFTVMGEPIISLSANALEMSSFVGFNATEDIWISNAGCDTLKITDISSTNGDISVDRTSLDVMPGDSAKVVVTFSPTLVSNYSATLNFANNSANASIAMSITGIGIAAPQISNSTDSIIEIAACGQSADSTFTIANTGDGILTYSNQTFVENIFNAAKAGKRLGTYSDAAGKERGMVLVDGYIYIALYDDSQVAKYDIANQEIEATYDMDIEPYGITYDGTYLWMGDYDNSTMYAYDLSLNAIGTSIDLPVPTPVITYDGEYFIIANRWTSSPEIYRMDHSGNIIETFTSDFSNLYDFNWVPQHNSGHLWVTDGGSYLKQVNLAGSTAQVVHTIDFSNDVTALIHDGTDFLCGDESNTSIYRIDDGYDENGPSWLSISSLSGNIASGAPDVEITATLNGEGLLAGTYNGGIIINTNDPAQASDTVFCSFIIQGTPDMVLSSKTFAFNNVIEGTTITDTLWISNSGCDTLKISNIANNNSDFSVNATNFNVLPNASKSVIISFAPSALGLLKDTLFIASNLLADTVLLAAEVIESPSIFINEDTLSDTLYTCGNATSVQNIEILNNSSTPLHFTIEKKAEKIEVLALTYGVDYAQEYVNTISAINQYYTNYKLTEINTTDAAELQAALVGKTTLLIPEQENGSSSVFEGFATVMQNFVNNGGNVIFCGTQNYSCISSTGLLSISESNSYSSNPLIVSDDLNQLTHGIQEPYIATNGTYPITITNSNMVNLVTIDGYTVVGYRPIGSGNVIFVAHDYYDFNANAARVIANAIKWNGNNQYCDLSAYSGTIGTGSAKTIIATFNSNSMPSGTYEGNILISSDDSYSPLDTVAYSFVIDGEPVMELPVTSINFPEVPLNSNISYSSLDIVNSGCDTLKITKIESDTTAFSVIESELDVMPFSTKSLLVYFSPKGFGPVTGKLTLNNNFNGQSEITLFGTGVQTHVVSVSTDTPNGYYKAGDIIDLAVRYNGNINLPGKSSSQPAIIALNTTPVANAVFKQIQGRDAIFEYVVGVDENSSALDYSIDTIKMNSTYLLDGNNNKVSHDLPALGTFSSNFNIVIDNIKPTVAISSAVANVTSASPIEVNILFSEAIAGFETSDIVVNNGIFSDLHAINNSNWVLKIMPIANGNVTVDIASAVTTDLAGNANLAAEQFVIEYDGQLPVLSLTSAVTSPTNAKPIVVTVSSNFDVTGLDVADFVVTNGTASNLLVLQAGKKWTIDVTPASDGNISVKLPVGSVINVNNNINMAEAIFTTRFDGTAPIFAITTTSSNPTNLSRIPVKIALSEVVDGFDISDVAVSNGTISNFTAVSNVLWTLDVLPVNGLVSVNINANAVTDSAKNSNLAASLKVVYDDVEPIIAISSVSKLTHAGSIVYNISFSEEVNGFAANDIKVVNGSVSGLQTIDSITFTASVAPIADGLVILNIADSVAFDQAGNANTEANPFEVTFDGTAPSVAITSTVNAITNANPIDVKITFSEVVKGFAASDIVITNGSVSGLSTADSTTFNASVIPAVDGIVTVDIADSVANDAAGNENKAADQYRTTYDRTSPEIIITSTAANRTNANPIDVKITFSEVVKGFAASDIVITNGSVSGLSTTDSIIFISNVIPAADGLVAVDIAASVANDVAGNANKAADQYRITYDRTSPGIIITSAAANRTNANPIDVTITFSEVVKGFAASDIVITNGSVSGLSTTDSITFISNVIPAADGLVAVDIAASVANDVAGNANTVAGQFSLTFDGTAPSVIISSTEPNLTNASPILVSVTFNEFVSDFTISEIKANNGSVTNLSTADSVVFVASVLPASNGVVSINVAENVAFDEAGNGNAVAVEFTVTFDGSLPQVTTIESSNITFNSATLDFTSNKAGKLYYAVLLKSTTAPTAGQIIDGSVTVVASGVLDVEKDVKANANLSELDEKTSYTVYAVVADVFQNVSEIKKLDFTTLESSIIDQNLRVKLYPNPVVNQLNVVIEQSWGTCAYNLYSINGQNIANGTIDSQHSVIEMNQLASGTYTLQLLIKGEFITYKIVK